MAKQLFGIARAAQAALKGEIHLLANSSTNSAADHRDELHAVARSIDHQRLHNAITYKSVSSGVPPGGAADRPVIPLITDCTTDPNDLMLVDVAETSPKKNTSVAKAKIQFPEVVHLNVGGSKLTTTLTTLQRDPRSKLAYMFSGDVSMVRDKDGRYCIDRDGRTFHHILNFLRDGSLPIGLTRCSRLELIRESKFYSLQALYVTSGGPQDMVELRASEESSSKHYSSTATRPQPLSRTRSFTSASSRPSGCPSSNSTADAGRFRNFEERCQQRSFMNASSAWSQDLMPKQETNHFFARLRFGHEYSGGCGGWVVSSPRNLCGIEYELHDACVARAPITAMNKLSKVGFKPCDDPPRLPPVSDFYTDKWSIMMYNDNADWLEQWEEQLMQCLEASKPPTPGTPSSLTASQRREHPQQPPQFIRRSDAALVPELPGPRLPFFNGTAESVAALPGTVFLQQHSPTHFLTPVQTCSPQAEGSSPNSESVHGNIAL